MAGFLQGSIPADIAVIMEFVDTTPRAPDLENGQADSEDEVEAYLDVDDEGAGIKDQGSVGKVATQSINSQVGPMRDKPVGSPDDMDMSSDKDSKEEADESSGSDSSSSSDESDSDSSLSLSHGLTTKTRQAAKSQLASMLAGEEASLCSDEEVADHGPAALHGPATTNEIVMPEVTIPTISSVSDDDPIEPLGDIFNVIDYVVVVKGVAGGTEKVLDSGSLLVFEDRKVLGEVFETFGPTTQPMYSVRFPTASMIDSELVVVGKKVYHVPTRSFFVFTRGLQALKGSDASNQYDEEVGDSEREFSDDEQELQHRQSLKRRRQAKTIDTEPLRAATTTITPSLINDYGDVPFNSDPYEDTSLFTPPANLDSPQRPTPAPYEIMSYDDQLSPDASDPPDKARNRPEGHHSGSKGMMAGRASNRGAKGNRHPHGDRGRGRERGARGNGRGRGDRGRGRGMKDRERGYQSSMHYSTGNSTGFYDQSLEEYDPRIPGPSATPSLDGFAQPLGQFDGVPPSYTHHLHGLFGGVGSSPQAQPYSFYPQQIQDMTPLGVNMNMVVPGVVPHINPRFFGAQLGMMGIQTPASPGLRTPNELSHLVPPSPRLRTPSSLGPLDGSGEGSARSHYSALPDRDIRDQI